MTKSKMITWLLQFYKASNQTCWYGVTYDSVEECLKSIESYLNKLTKDQVYKDHYSQYVC